MIKRWRKAVKYKRDNLEGVQNIKWISLWKYFINPVHDAKLNQFNWIYSSLKIMEKLFFLGKKG